MAPRGVYRERNEWGNGQNSVVVDYGTSHFDVTEDKYREDGYQPPFEERFTHAAFRCRSKFGSAGIVSAAVER